MLFFDTRKTLTGNKMKNLINTGLIIALLTGCGAEIAYKRGATAEDLKAEKIACMKAGNEAELEKCMEENGWALQKLDGTSFSDDELFATATVAKDNRMTAPAEKSIQTTESITIEDSHHADGNTKSDEKLQPAKDVSATSTAPVKPQPSLLDTYVIKSWWKMGGGAALLEQNMNECSEKLGEAHIPNKKTFTFTRGFAICMREKGWRGLLEK
jgi:hypothetical protein